MASSVNNSHVTWYTWLAQGREIGVSSTFLDNLAKALQLDKLGVDVINVKFLQKDAGREKFISFFAKRARGLMARWMSTDRPSKPADLSGFNLEGYRIKKSASSENELVFVRPKPAAKKKAS